MHDPCSCAAVPVPVCTYKSAFCKKNKKCAYKSALKKKNSGRWGRLERCAEGSVG
jgi:hypothetical protein